MASWYCDSCLVVLCGVQFVLFCVFTRLFPCWHFWPPAAFFFRLDFKWGEKKSCPNIDWSEDPGRLPAHVKGCHCSCLSGSLPEFKVFRLLQEVHTTWLVEGNIDRLKTGKSYRWEPQASRFESHNRTPSRLTLQGCMAMCWRSQKIWGIGRLIPAERKFSCRLTRTSCCLMTPNTPRGAWPPSLCAQLSRSANKLSWLHLSENSGSASFLN